MKKFFAVFIFSLNYFFAVNAQTVKWSQVIESNKKIPYFLILGESDDGGFYVLRSNMSLEHDKQRSGFKNRTYVLQSFSDDLVLRWEKNLLTSFADGYISDVTLANGRVIVTSYLNPRKSKTYYFYAQYLDGRGNWVDKPVLLDSVLTEKLDDNNKPGLLLSRDQSFMAFSYRKIGLDKNSQSFQVIVIDTNLAFRYAREIDVPVSDNLFNPLDYILTDQGSFFVLGIRYTTEKRIKAPEQSYYELYGYNKIVDRIVHTTIKSETRFLTDVGMTADNLNKSIVVAGFYSDKTTYSTAGVFYYALTEDSLVETRTVHTPFSLEYLKKFFGDRKEDRELVNYSIDRLIVRRDGGVALIAESIYETTRSYFDYYMQTYTTHYYYHFGNIMVLSINPDGNILWNKVIAKDQNSVDDGGYLSSYYLAITGGSLVTLYNKYVEDDSSVLLTSVEPNGAQRTDVLFNEMEKVSIVPRSARQVDDDTILMPAFRQNKLYIARIVF